MKELTFKSYLKNYVKNNSGLNTLDITKLVNSISKGESEIKDALILYCIMCGKVVTLKRVLKREEIEDFNIEDTLITERDLKSAKSKVNPVYKEIYNKYIEEKNSGIIAHERKENLRRQILRLNKKHNFSMRRLSIVAGVDASNFNTFMKNKDYPKVSTEKLEKVVEYLEEV